MGCVSLINSNVKEIINCTISYQEEPQHLLWPTLEDDLNGDTVYTAQRAI